jgi:hypothetical protein
MLHNGQSGWMHPGLLSIHGDKITMWRVIIECSADSWAAHAVAFKAIAARYSDTPLASKKMKGDERRIMEYQLEDLDEAEDFIAECQALDGFTATFEAL